MFIKLLIKIVPHKNYAKMLCAKGPWLFTSQREPSKSAQIFSQGSQTEVWGSRNQYSESRKSMLYSGRHDQVRLSARLASHSRKLKKDKRTYFLIKVKKKAKVRNTITWPFLRLDITCKLRFIVAQLKYQELCSEE